jgi:hypothetical protein
MSRRLNFQQSILILLIAVAAIAACSSDARAGAQEERRERMPVLSPAEAERIIAARSRFVVNVLRRRDMQGLARFVHPTRGLSFSPYPGGYPSDLTLTRRELISAWRSRRARVWGEEDGTGDPIRLTFRRYFARYVYDRNYSRVGVVSYNRPTGHGNNINTLLENHPRAILVEYHVPGRDPRYNGMDWRSLWLVFERAGREWFLVRIAHDEWGT